MKIAFISNFFNHHQQPVSDTLNRITENKYIFCETTQMPQERKNLGYTLKQSFAFVKKPEETAKCQKEIDEADLVIIGSAPDIYIKNRIKNRKLIFRVHERPLKNGLELLKYPVRFLKWHLKNPFNKPVYMLCSSAYTSSDYSKFGLFKNKAYKWGYFPKCVKYDNIDEVINKKEDNTILWCGRFLELKRPFDVITLAEMLKNNGYNFRIDIIGNGELSEPIKKAVRDKNLEDSVHILDAMTPDEIRSYMKKTSIYLFTSNKYEGWGAVVNEAMNSACAVVASHACGSVPYLIKNGENGIIYQCGNVDMLYKNVVKLLKDKNKQITLGKNAYKTIIEEWNAEVASERLVKLAEHIISGEKSPNLFLSGPCSCAEKLSDKWNG